VGEPLGGSRTALFDAPDFCVSAPLFWCSASAITNFTMLGHVPVGRGDDLERHRRVTQVVQTLTATP
jgi:hypothetical protein